MESKVVLAKLKEMGEFVTSASSTIEPPVARRLIEAFPNAKVETEAKPVKKAAVKKAAPKKAAKKAAPKKAAKKSGKKAAPKKAAKKKKK